MNFRRSFIALSVLVLAGPAVLAATPGSSAMENILSNASITPMQTDGVILMSGEAGYVQAKQFGLGGGFPEPRTGSGRVIGGNTSSNVAMSSGQDDGIVLLPGEAGYVEAKQVGLDSGTLKLGVATMREKGGAKTNAAVAVQSKGCHPQHRH